MEFISENITSEGYLSGQTLTVGYANITNLNVLNVTGVSSTDYYVTGGTYSNGTLTLDRQNGSVVISGFSTGGTGTDTYVTGFTYNSNNFVISQNNGQPDLSVNLDILTGLTLTGDVDMSGNVIKNLDLLGLGSINGTAIGNFILTTSDGYKKSFTGLTYLSNVLTATSIDGSQTIVTIPDTFTTGVTFNNNTRILTISRNNGQPDLTTTISDNFVTGGTFSNGTLTLDRQNGSVIVTGLVSADTFVTAFTYNNANLLTISRNNGQPDLNVTVNNMTGLTVNGLLTVNDGMVVTGLSTTNQLRVTNSPVAGYVLTSDSLGNAAWQPSATGTGATKLDYQTVTGLTTSSTPLNSSAWIDITGMTITTKNLGSSATTYTFNFSCTASLSANAGIGNIRVVLNGNPINGSTRQRTNSSGLANQNLPMVTNGFITGVKNGDIIKVQANSPTGQWSITDRAFTITGVLTINLV